MRRLATLQPMRQAENEKRSENTMTYQQQKEKARQKAIEWQYENSQEPMSYGELANTTRYFMALAKRYGLVKEFTENGII